MNIYTLNVDPCPEPRMSKSDAWSERPAVMRYFYFRDMVNAELKRLHLNLDDVFVHDFHFFVPMPPSWPKKKKAAMLGKPHQQKPDADNYEKALLDAIYRGKSDERVYKVTHEKTWSDIGYIVIKV